MVMSPPLPAPSPCARCGFDARQRPSIAGADVLDLHSHIPAGSPTQTLSDAQQRIADLEAQVRLLNQKVAVAADRHADYEDEVGRLRAQTASLHLQPHGPSSSLRGRRAAPPPAVLATTLGVAGAALQPSSPSLAPNSGAQAQSAGLRPDARSPSRSTFAMISPRSLTSFLSPGRPSSPASVSVSTPPPRSPALDAAGLLEALYHEQSLREAAEARLNATSREIEELSAALFERANHMVAEERRARARLQERVHLLERRDTEKRCRLDRLELAIDHISTVRALLLRSTPDAAAPLLPLHTNHSASKQLTLQVPSHLHATTPPPSPPPLPRSQPALQPT